jgi:hypothetical protein
MAIGISANTGTGPVMGNPALKPSGEIQGVGPPTATSTTAAITPAQAALEDRLPKFISQKDQAEATGADPRRYGDVGEAATAQIPARSSAALMNAAPARRTG